MNKIYRVCELISQNKFNGKNDITHHSECELSLIVMNDEYFYTMRKYEKRLVELLREVFIFTDEQLEVLLTDISEDLKG
jgi:hypothetical protein